MLQRLHPHADFAASDGVALSVEWSVSRETTLTIAYHVTDPEGHIAWPAAAQGRTDGLWRHTCFEAFIASASSPTYAEFNLAPSGAWAAYAFDDYRAGMRDLALAAAPVIEPVEFGHWRVRLDLAGLKDLIGPAPWRLAVTAVIEARDGSKSFWSLAHPSGKPDFHHADCFAARLG
ncbi:DOMON-like domain-containing protein [Sphingomonas sp. 35-24ZXX]|uniref:DOMON-like domain-containing protein n=1 Tax=Sphingomonas sp. 35-24ZXX TaxID=1545915 RepID=UPI00053BE434|nr:DOMON-like domain-containing protein [Sphingomonas sp. 35-24ZXX]